MFQGSVDHIIRKFCCNLSLSITSSTQIAINTLSAQYPYSWFLFCPSGFSFITTFPTLIFITFIFLTLHPYIIFCLSMTFLWKLWNLLMSIDHLKFGNSKCYIFDMISFNASLVAQWAKNLPAVQETWDRSLRWEDPLEKEMATHSSILAWKI